MAQSRHRGAVLVVSVVASIGLGAMLAFGAWFAVLVAGAAALGVCITTQQGLRTLILAVMIGASFTAPMNGLRVGGFLTVSDLFLITATSLVIMNMLMQPGVLSLGLYKPFLMAAGLILLGGCIGTAVSARGTSGIIELVKFFAASVILLIVVARWAPTRREVRCLAWAFVGGATVSALLGLWLLRTGIQERSIGLTTHPNHLGIVSLLACGTAVGLALQYSGIGRKLGAGFAAALGAGLLASGSRAAVVGALTSFVVFVVITRSGRALRWAGLCAVVCAILLALGAVEVSSTSALGRLLGQDPTSHTSDAARDAARQESFLIINSNPLTGGGFGVLLEAHNLYLQMFAAAGVLGLAGMLGIVMGTVRLARRRDRREILGSSMLCSYIGYLVAGLFSNVIADRYLWLHLALTIALFARLKSAHVSGPPSGLILAGRD